MHPERVKSQNFKSVVFDLFAWSTVGCRVKAAPEIIQDLTLTSRHNSFVAVGVDWQLADNKKQLTWRHTREVRGRSCNFGCGFTLHLARTYSALSRTFFGYSGSSQAGLLFSKYSGNSLRKPTEGWMKNADWRILAGNKSGSHERRRLPCDCHVRGH